MCEKEAKNTLKAGKNLANIIHFFSYKQTLIFRNENIALCFKMTGCSE